MISSAGFDYYFDKNPSCDFYPALRISNGCCRGAVAAEMRLFLSGKVPSAEKLTTPPRASQHVAKSSGRLIFRVGIR